VVKPKRRLVAVSELFDPIQFLARLLGHPHESVRLAAVAGLARHESEPSGRLFLKVAEGDVSLAVRLAAKRALEGNG
jgi:HEAT repeat protein